MTAAVHLMGVPHGRSCRTTVDSPLVATQAVAVAKAGHEALAAFRHLLLEHQPGALAVQIGLQAVRVAVAARKRRECDVAVLPAAHHLPLLHPAGGIDQR